MKDLHIREVLKDGYFFVRGKSLYLSCCCNEKVFEAHLLVNRKFKGRIHFHIDEDKHTYKVLPYPTRVDNWIKPTKTDMKLLVRGIAKHTDWKYVE